jgi:hypothetical protein
MPPDLQIEYLSSCSASWLYNLCMWYIVTASQFHTPESDMLCDSEHFLL